MTRFLLIRHGLTDAVGHGYADSNYGASLNDNGRAQAEQLARRLAGLPLDAVVSSPLPRARETAALIAESHGVTLDVREAFVEYEFGEWDGARFSDLTRDPRWRQFNHCRSVNAAPDGELMLDVQRRAVSALLNLASQWPGGTVAVVSHGDVIRALLLFFLGMPIDFLHRLEIDPAHVSVVDVNADGPTVRLVNGDICAEGG